MILSQLNGTCYYWGRWDVAQVVKHSALKIWILLHGGSILHGGCICSLGYFPFQPVIHNWSIKGCGMCCPACGEMHINDPLLLIGKSSFCGKSGFPLKKCHNDHMLDVQKPMIWKQMCSRGVVKQNKLSFLLLLSMEVSFDKDTNYIIHIYTSNVSLSNSF